MHCSADIPRFNISTNSSLITCKTESSKPTALSWKICPSHLKYVLTLSHAFACISYKFTAITCHGYNAVFSGYFTDAFIPKTGKRFLLPSQSFQIQISSVKRRSHLTDNILTRRIIRSNAASLTLQERTAVSKYYCRQVS